MYEISFVADPSHLKLCRVYNPHMIDQLGGYTPGTDTEKSSREGVLLLNGIANLANLANLVHQLTKLSSMFDSELCSTWPRGVCFANLEKQY